MKKSSDNTNQPRKLEEVFRDGFEPAEVTPRASIWHRIEQELEVKQAGYYKKRLAWYRSIAAASITLLILAISYFWYDTQTSYQGNFPTATSSDIIAQNKNNPVPAQVNAPETTSHTNQPRLKTNPTERIASTDGQLAERKTSLRARSGINQKFAATKEASSITSVATRKNLAPDNGSDQGTDSPKNTFAAGENQLPSPSRLPADSAEFAVVAKSSLFHNDSAAAFTAAAKPEKAKKTGQTSRWALGGGTGSQYFEQNIKFANAGTNAPAYSLLNSYANVSKNAAGNSIEAASEEFNENTRSAFSYRAAVAVNYRLNNKWSVEAGLTFAENKAQTTTTYIIYKRPAALNRIANIKLENNDAIGNSNLTAPNVTIPVTIFLAKLTDNNLTSTNATVDKVAPFTMYYRYRQASLPVKLRYQQGRGKWFNFVQAGGALNILLQTSVLSDSPKVPAVEYNIGQASPFRKWYLTALGSVGRGLKLSEAWQVQGSLDVARNFSTLTLSPDQIPHVNRHKSYYVGFGISSSYVIGKKVAPENK